MIRGYAYLYDNLAVGYKYISENGDLLILNTKRFEEFKQKLNEVSGIKIKNKSLKIKDTSQKNKENIKIDEAWIDLVYNDKDFYMTIKKGCEKEAYKKLTGNVKLPDDKLPNDLEERITIEIMNPRIRREGFIGILIDEYGPVSKQRFSIDLEKFGDIATNIMKKYQEIKA